MRVLFLAHLFPLPLDSGGKIKSYHTLKALSRRHEVHVLAYVRNQDELSQVPELEQLCSNVEVVELRRGKNAQAADLLRSLARARSFVIGRDFRRSMQEAVRRAIRDIRPDIVHIDHLQMAQFVDPAGHYLTVLDHHNVESAIVRRMAENCSGLACRFCAAIEWPKLQALELEACRSCDAVLTVSEEDKATLQRLDPLITNVRVVPIGVDTDYFRPIDRHRGSRNILSIGTMHWPPNVDSILHFCRDILPLITREIPDCTVTVAGQHPVPVIQALASNQAIRVTGYVDDIRNTARDCGAFIIPLRSGSGVRVKGLNAMAMGLPIVSTSIGVEGLHITPGQHMLLADTAQDFARAVIRVLKSPQLAESLGREARRLVSDLYSWETVDERLLGVYDELQTGRLAT